ncbi:unnamed protein product [Trichogramma brassicae]|uniref:Uncharacterized protein n=1 Tax=Trichogramma brassicae TaxID=86971 RepID=A0A6H5J236_9HYME|nr:unnamed protein product [Trichogramma brassicae]
MIAVKLIIRLTTAECARYGKTNSTDARRHRGLCIKSTPAPVCVSVLQSRDASVKTARGSLRSTHFLRFRFINSSIYEPCGADKHLYYSVLLGIFQPCVL